MLWFVYRHGGGRDTVIGDSPSRYFLRRHREHLLSLGLDPEAHANSAGSSAQVKELFDKQLEQASSMGRDVWKGALQLGSSEGFDVVSTFFAENLFAVDQVQEQIGSPRIGF